MSTLKNQLPIRQVNEFVSAAREAGRAAAEGDVAYAKETLRDIRRADIGIPPEVARAFLNAFRNNTEASNPGPVGPIGVWHPAATAFAAGTWAGLGHIKRAAAILGLAFARGYPVPAMPFVRAYLDAGQLHPWRPGT
jgi:hypothetical protein